MWNLWWLCGTAFILVGTLITPLSSFSLNLEQFQMVEALSHLEEMTQKILMDDWQAKYDRVDLLLHNWTNTVTYKSNFCFLKQYVYIYENQGCIFKEEKQEKLLLACTWENIENNFIVLGVTELDSKFL